MQIIFNHSYLNSRKSIFLSFLFSKLLILPFLYIVISFLDNRPHSIFLIGDLTRYELTHNIVNIFNLENFQDFKNNGVSNVGYMVLIFIIKSFTNSENIKLFFYSLTSLITISYSQSIILDLIFTQNNIVNIKIKTFSFIFSLINFYVLIYSFKPSSDVFGCLGIAILIEALIKSENHQIKNKYFINWIFIFLCLCLFRNNLILVLPFLCFTKLFNRIKCSIKESSISIRFSALSMLSLLLILNFAQFIGATYPFMQEQLKWGIASLGANNSNYFSLAYVKDLFVFLSKKIIFLLSAREAVGMTGDWLISTDQKINVTSFPIIANMGSALILFSINTLGMISIFRFFSKIFLKSFLFSLIPLIPLLSYASHHRYFLPYAIITSAALPFLFFKSNDLNPLKR